MFSNIDTVRPKSHDFANRLNSVAKQVLGYWGIEMIVSEKDAPRNALTKFLEQLMFFLPREQTLHIDGGLVCAFAPTEFHKLLQIWPNLLFSPQIER